MGLEITSGWIPMLALHSRASAPNSGETASCDRLFPVISVCAFATVTSVVMPYKVITVPVMSAHVTEMSGRYRMHL